MGRRIRLYVVVVLFVALATQAFKMDVMRRVQEDDYKAAHNRDPKIVDYLNRVDTQP